MGSKQPDRYSFIDAYILEELRRDYTLGSFRERLHLLTKLNRRHIPIEVALLAVEDSDARIRAWFAKNAGELQYGSRDDSANYHNLETRLREDPDPYVRACVYENRRFGVFNQINQPIQLFLEAAPLERLALVRNPEVGQELIEQIFTYGESQLGITVVERRELIQAFLTNAEAINESHKDSFDFVDGANWASKSSYFSMLWKLISQWPSEDEDFKQNVYRVIGTDDATRQSIFCGSDDATTRWYILANCSPDRHWATLLFGRRDKDESNRATAYQRTRLNKEQVAEALAGNDVAALGGMASNHLLSIEDLESVVDRLHELGDESHAGVALQTIRELEKTYPPKVPHKLFGSQGREGHFLEEKIDYIGNKLIRWQEKINYALADKNNADELSLVVTFLKRIFR